MYPPSLRKGRSTPLPESFTITDLTRGVYRRIYAGFIHGKRINSVSIEAEAWFWRLNALADDFGNLRAEPANLCIEASPKRRVTADKVEGWMRELASANLITPYIADDEPLAHINGFVDLQPFNRGKNGKARPIRRVPEWAGESRCVQGGPKESNPPNSYSDSDTHSDTITDTKTTRPQPRPAAGAGERSLSGEEETFAKNLSKRPEWLKDGCGWLTERTSRELVATHGMKAMSDAVKAARQRRGTLTNPAGFVIGELKNGTCTGAPS